MEPALHRQQLCLDALPAPPKPHDIVFVIGDGLSPLAIEQNSVPFSQHLLPALEQAQLRLGPVALVKNARMAIGDEVATRLNAQLVMVLIGESRNCISNVRPTRLPYAAAAHKLCYLISEARLRQLSGVQLKDESTAPTAELAAHPKHAQQAQPLGYPFLLLD